MTIETPPIDGLLVLTPRVFEDERGHFFESYNEALFNEATGKNIHFFQDNQSLSKKGVLRGLHFQNPPFAQGKLVRVIHGSVYDVAVDIRKDSPTYGQYFGIELSAENGKMFWIPEGFAHGFLALEENTIFSYKCTNNYHKDSEGALLWNDSDINIEWPEISELIISSKDQEAERFNTFASRF